MIKIEDLTEITGEKGLYGFVTPKILYVVNTSGSIGYVLDYKTSKVNKVIRIDENKKKDKKRK